MKNIRRLALAALLLIIVAVALAAWAWQEPGAASPAGESASPESAAVSPQSSVALSPPGGVGASVNPQAVPAPGGLTVSAIGSVTMAADEAYVVIVPEQIYTSSGIGQLTDTDRQQIRENLAEIGLSADAVEFENLALYGPSSISVAVGLPELAEQREAILAAVESVIRRSESHGVIYGLTEENCEKAIALARRQAIPKAQRAADDLAAALEVQRGAVTAALEHPQATTGYGFPGLSMHGCGAPISAPYPNLQPFDAAPEVEVSVGLQITYSIPQS